MNDKEREALVVEATRQAKKCSDILKKKGSSCLEFIKERDKLEKMKEQLRDEHKQMIHAELER